MSDPTALALSVSALLASLAQGWFTVVKPRRERRRRLAVPRDVPPALTQEADRG